MADLGSVGSRRGYADRRADRNVVLRPGLSARPTAEAGPPQQPVHALGP